MSPKIGVTHLQADDIFSTGFKRKDAVCHGDGGRLANKVKLSVDALHDSFQFKWRLLRRRRAKARLATTWELMGVSVSNKQKSRQSIDGMNICIK
jgi:hypothetical protein